MIRWIAIGLALLSLSCASLGETPRQQTVAVVNGVLGSPFYLASYLSGFFLNALAYPTAWIAGKPEGDVPVWFSADYGPTYASVNTPWCWLYVGTEPEDRAVAATIPAGTHVRQIPLQSVDYEWPPTVTLCRTNVGITRNKRGDESFPLAQ